jgi:hypothetical protein
LTGSTGSQKPIMSHRAAEVNSRQIARWRRDRCRFDCTHTLLSSIIINR